MVYSSNKEVIKQIGGKWSKEDKGWKINANERDELIESGEYSFESSALKEIKENLLKEEVKKSPKKSQSPVNVIDDAECFIDSDSMMIKLIIKYLKIFLLCWCMDINFNEEVIDFKEKEKVIISKQQRNGRKCWTLIENFIDNLDDKADAKKFVKFVKKINVVMVQYKKILLFNFKEIV